MRVGLATILLALSLSLSGCLASVLGGSETPAVTPAPLDAPDEAWLAVRALMADVPCDAPVGDGTSANLLKLGALPFEDGAVGEVDVLGDLMLVSRYQSGGLHVVDIANPTMPTLVGTLALDETRALDVKWMPSGTGAVIGDFGAVHLVDMTDPTMPALLSTFEYANTSARGQAHMLEVLATDEGEEFVFVATQTGGQPLLVLQRVGDALELVGTHMWSAVLASDPALGNHDMTLVHDELLDKPVLYVAEGLLGWSALDVSDPTKPVKIGGWLSPEPGLGYTHTVRVEFADGKRIVATMQEVGQNTLKIYDATNLDAPLLLARWNADPTRPHIPEHNIQLKDGMLYMAHYTEGFYVFNISAVERGAPLVGTLDMQPIAHYAVETPAAPDELGFANYWDITVVKGVIYVSDTSVAGVTAVGFGCLAAGEESASVTD